MKQKLKKKKIKKKGFTLVELLAVIVILAIIMVITVPTVLGSISEAKKSAFNTVGETMKKYLKDNYNNCKLNIGNLASYDKEIFNEQCQIRTEKNPEDLSRALIKNSGYSEKDIKEVEISQLGDGDFGVLVIPDKDGNFGEFNTYIEGTYEGNCWTIEPIDNGEYEFTEFHGINKETGNIIESCGVTTEGEEYIITIPSKYNGVSISTLGSKLFFESYEKEESFYRNIKEINIAEGITTIAEGNDGYTESGEYFPAGTFANVGINAPDGLIVNLPNSLTKIGNGAFANSGLNSITIPSGVKEIEDYIFMSTQLDSITIPSGVQRIGDYAFFDNEPNNRKLVIPSSVKIIGESAFENHFCEELIFEGADDGTSQLTTIGNGAFAQGRLKKVTIPSSVETIGNYAFFINNDISSVTIINTTDNPSNLAIIGKRAFDGHVFENIELPDGVEIVG